MIFFVLTLEKYIERTCVEKQYEIFNSMKAAKAKAYKEIQKDLLGLNMSVSKVKNFSLEGYLIVFSEHLILNLFSIKAKTKSHRFLT